MVYEKDKIKRLINYKDKYTEGQLKNDLEWIIEIYNEYFMKIKDYENKQKEYNRMIKKYFNIEDEKATLKEKLELRTKRYIYIKEKYRELESKYNAYCKNFKNMI